MGQRNATQRNATQRNETKRNAIYLASLLILLCLFLFAGCSNSNLVNVQSSTPKIGVYFSPDGGCTKAITDEIKQARESILVQAYSFTSDPIAQALIVAYQRGIKVEIILDKTQRKGKGSDTETVAVAGIPTFIDSEHAIAHNKIIIIDSKVLITGSFNFSKNAEEENAENLLIIKDQPELVKKYIDNYLKHKEHSEGVTSCDSTQLIQVPHEFTTSFQKPIMAGYPATLDIVYSVQKPSSEEAEKALRATLDSILTKEAKNDILASAWFTPDGSEIKERMIPLLDGSTSLCYISKDKKVVTMNQHDGTKAKTSQNKEFFVEYVEHAVIVSPGKKFASLAVIFPTKPNKTEDEIYRILIDELKKAVLNQNPKLKTTASPNIGDPENPAGQTQMKRADGKYILIEYDPLSGNIKEFDKNKILDSIK